ncbi:hypothetical protein CEXT_425251, partial [Caerostris extrusa]
DIQGAVRKEGGAEEYKSLE